MAFLEKADFKSAIRDYQLDAITDDDDTIVEVAIDMAIEEVSSIFTPSDKKVWEDGRPHYDVEAIFTATGADRNPLMMGNTLTVAIWHLVFLCNVGVEYDKAEARYDRAITYLKALAKGDMNSGTLPRITIPPPDDDQPFGFGSRLKFNHDY